MFWHGAEVNVFRWPYSVSALIWRPLWKIDR